MTLQPLSVDLLRIDGSTQNRAAINQDVVDDYADLISASKGDWPFPPLDVFFDGSAYFTSDGFHRLLAAQRAKRGSVPCKVHKGTAKDAKIFGMTANDRHGLRMTRAEKRSCVEWLIDHGGKMTQQEIAEKSGVSTRTVRGIVADRKSKLSESSRKFSAPLSGGAQPPRSGGAQPPPNTAGGVGGPGHGAETQHQAGKSRDAHPSAPAGDVFDEAIQRNRNVMRGESAPPKTPPKQLDRSAWYKQWDQAIGPLVRLVDKIAAGVGESRCNSHKAVHKHLNAATKEMMEWMGVKQ